MNTTRRRGWRNELDGRTRRRAGLLGLLALLGLLPLAGAAQTPAFANPAFQRTWTRSDGPVAAGTVTRGYYWGPQPGAVKQEAYAEAANGARQVQYFDKSRMEINNPSADPASPFYVTNGLLTVELVSGRLQVGDRRYIVRYPAEIPLASDTDDATAPTYAAFARLLGDAPVRKNQPVTTLVDRAGKTTEDTSLGNDANAALTYYEPQTKHNIARVFWAFLNAPGPVLQNGQTVTAPLSNPWFYAAGYPISEPYWARVKVAGQANTLVLIQLFQRRVLTYTPSAPQAFRVQVGNIGQHYYDWRYNFAGKPATTPTTAPAQTPTALPTLGPTGLTVFAAVSLLDSFKEEGTNFKAANPNVSDLQFNFQGSQLLVTQLQQGAPADVFASADKTSRDKAVAANLIDGTPQELLRNVLVVVLPADNPANITSLKDLARPGVKIALAAPSVPVGTYSQQVLDKLAADPAYGSSFKQQVNDNVVTHEDNVKQVLTRVQLDQVDAGIVYITDALAANKSASGNIKPVKTLEIPVQYNVVAVYYIALVKGAAHAAAGKAFISYVLSAAGQAVLVKYGFIPAGGSGNPATVAISGLVLRTRPAITYPILNATCVQPSIVFG